MNKPLPKPRHVRPAIRSVHIPPPTARNPPGFALYAVLAGLIWPLGLIGAIAFLCDPEKRSAGVALFLISVASGILTYFLFWN